MNQIAKINHCFIFIQFSYYSKYLGALNLTARFNVLTNHAVPVVLLFTLVIRTRIIMTIIRSATPTTIQK